MADDPIGQTDWVTIPLVLASGSPRRRQLLSGLVADIMVLTPDVDETPAPGEDPRSYVERISRDKAATVDSLTHDGAVIIAADTCVTIDGRILGKPNGSEAAAAMLRELSDRPHHTITGVTVRSPNGCDTISVVTEVMFAALSDDDIDWYVATGEPLDKAGAYGLQGLAGVFVRRIEGSHSNVIGLPLAETAELLRRHGVAVAGSGPSAVVK